MNIPSTNLSEQRPYRTLQQILAGKAPGVVSIALDESVFRALQLMAERDVGAVVVQDQNKVVGMISERDYARKVVLAGKASGDTPVSEIMTRNVVSVTPEHTVPQCMQLMTEKRMRHLPVLENGWLIGIVSIGDLLKEMLLHDESLLKDLAVERIMVMNPNSSSY